MSRITIPSTADYAIIREIKNEKNVCCKICLERGFEHNSYAATQGVNVKELTHKISSISEK